VLRSVSSLAVLLAALPACADTPEARAVAYLVREVPAWSRANKCFSCYNNGDGARALFQAKRTGYAVPAEALADTTKWLMNPERWDDNKGDPAFSDKRLANLQFAAALRSGADYGHVKVIPPAANIRLAKDQSDSGAWEIEPSNPVGSPVTYGSALATYIALRTLNNSSHDAQIRKAWEWLQKLEPKNTISASALLLASPLETNRLHPTTLQQCFNLLKSSQNSDGGWGPYAQSPSEPFDTAVALLAIRPRQDATELVKRGREFLLRHQNADGSWPATTRPPRGDSYAQQVSTTAWALIALLESGAPMPTSASAPR
jgi:hypothetical protein